MVRLADTGTGPIARRRFIITGIVQGVGFRPFVFRLAAELTLTGWVRNSPAGVELELQGRQERLADFSRRLQTELPPLAAISSLESAAVPAVEDEAGFVILPSSNGRAEAQIAPDTAICADCLRELFDPADRRYLHPFITCTNCGPRWTIVTGVPYDRPRTTMADFPFCPACEYEYRNPADRRFHAQPICCCGCGPNVTIHPSHPDPVRQAANLLEQGKIVAVKGLGGYHLAVDACSEVAVARLRLLKKRDEKPFAVMVPDLQAVRQLAELSEMEERLLASPEAPIVIVRGRSDTGLSHHVAPGSGWVGLMLAYTPLHQLLFQALAHYGGTLPNQAVDSGHVPISALVMTSANISDEPMLSDDQEAFDQLAGIADAILTHNRPVHVRTDDSVLRVFQGNPLFYRRSRGYVPRAVRLPFDSGRLLAVGAELKNTVCLTRGNQAFLSQHIGDLKNDRTLQTFEQTISHLQQILEVSPEMIVCDTHPDYLSTRFAEDSGLPVFKVQHHHAHMASCMAENDLDGELIGVIFDGTGLGDDGTIWGGEFLVGGYECSTRKAHLQQIPMPGGDAAVREPYRMALSWLYMAFGNELFRLPLPFMDAIPEQDRSLLLAMLERRINAPLTSSCGRLFDAVAAMISLHRVVSFDGQAAMALEALAEQVETTGEYPYEVISGGDGWIVNPLPMLCAIADAVRDGASPPQISRRFHTTMIAATVRVCQHIREATARNRVVLSGGVFQNRLLTEGLCNGLSSCGFQVYTHRQVPPNDGGLALGQAAIAGRRSTAYVSCRTNAGC